MCGRYAITIDPVTLAEHFGIELSGVIVHAAPSFNIAPTQEVPIVRMDLPAQISIAKWGLIPSWSKDPAIGAKLINARSETITEKPSFRTAFKKRRCLVLADGFYEWQKFPNGKSKKPMFIQLKTGRPFAMAGLYEFWKPAEPNTTTGWVTSCTIITTAANSFMQPVHDRMPVFLPSGAEVVWLDPSASEPELTRLFEPYPSDLLVMHEVSPRVNTYRNNDADLVRPVDD